MIKNNDSWTNFYVFKFVYKILKIPNEITKIPRTLKEVIFIFIFCSSKIKILFFNLFDFNFRLFLYTLLRNMVLYQKIKMLIIVSWSLQW